MAASTLADDRAPAAVVDARRLRRLAVWASTALVAALWLIVLVVLARRAAGSFTRTLSSPALLAVGLAAALGTTVDRAVLWAGRPTATWRWALPGAGALLLALAVTVPGTSLAQCLLLWWAPIGLEVAAWRWYRQAQGMAPSPEPAEPQLLPTMPPVPAEPSDVGETEPPPPEVTQHLERSRTEDGGELLSGWLRIDLAPRQRSGSAHVAFCPPFAATPMAEAAPIEGPEADVEVAEVHAYGARFDVKLKRASDEACRVGIEVNVWQGAADESSAFA